jgi:hypothetical protein
MSMAIYSIFWRALMALLLTFTMTGCYRTQVRHLSSDVCLLQPGQTTREEVLAYLGDPDQRQINPEKGETWIYYQGNKSLLRKMPYLGKNMGEEQFDVVMITFQGDLVRTCAYRSFDENEFNRKYLAGNEPSNS